MELKGIKLSKSKKGIGISDMYPAILTLILVAILLGVGIYTLVNIRRAVQTDFIGEERSANISSGTTTLNGSLPSLYIPSSSVQPTWSLNSTPITNFTFSEESGIITWGGDVIDVDLVNVTYTYNYDRQDAEKAITVATTGIDDIADWFAIIVVVLAAAIILGIVMKSFGRGEAI